MQQKKLAKVNPFPDYIRVSDPNMELLSAYTILAKGEDRSLNDFAKSKYEYIQLKKKRKKS